MIGQKAIQNDISKLISNGKFPRFTILMGQRGSGKTTLAKIIANELKAMCVVSDVKAEDVREIIEQSYKATEPTVYVLPNANKMSNVAQNAILKVTEEPPNKAYFIVTVENDSQILNTLLSRGTVFRMDVYSCDEIYEYANEKYKEKMANFDTKQVVLDICETPGEVDLLMTYNVCDFWDYASLVVDNVAEVSGAHSFKIGEKLNLADNDDKYDLRLFWKAFITRCMNKIIDDPFKYGAGAHITGTRMQDLRVSGINKQMLFDRWLMEIRREWLEIE